MRTFYIIACSAALATSGCGGGSNTTLTSIDTNPIRVFSDGAGAASVSASEGGETATGYIITPELGLALQELESAESAEPFDINDIPVVATGPNTVIRQGAIAQDGVVLNATLFITEDEDAAAFLLEEPTFNDSLLLTFGDGVDGIPSSGIARYSGVFGLQDLEFDNEPEVGTFSANVNFSDTSQTVEFTGTTSSYTLTGNASIQGSSFTGANLLLTDTEFTDNFSATINGDLHGDSANSMAGIVYSNDDGAVYRGGFVGSR